MPSFKIVSIFLSSQGFFAGFLLIFQQPAFKTIVQPPPPLLSINVFSLNFERGLLAVNKTDANQQIIIIFLVIYFLDILKHFITKLLPERAGRLISIRAEAQQEDGAGDGWQRASARTRPAGQGVVPQRFGSRVTTSLTYNEACPTLPQPGGSNETACDCSVLASSGVMRHTTHSENSHFFHPFPHLSSF